MLIKPFLTEKSAEKLAAGLYVFEVEAGATKPAIAQCLRRDFKVEPVAIRIVNMKAKKVTFRKRQGTQASRKKAYIQLAPKQSIPGFELPKTPSTPAMPQNAGELTANKEQS